MSMRGIPGSLSVRITALLVAIVVVGLAIAGLATTAALRGYLLGRVDSSLRDVSSPFTNQAGPVDSDDVRRPGVDPRRAPPSDYFVAFLASDGTTVGTRSNPIDDSVGKPQLPAMTAAEVAQARGVPFTVRGTADGEWRVIARPYVEVGGGRGRPAVPPEMVGGSVLVATSLAPLESTVTRLVTLQSLVGLIVAVVLGLLGFLLVRRSLAPLREVEVTAGAVAGGDLSRRVDTVDESTEVGRLGVAFNAMVARIQTAFAAQARSEAAARESEDRMRRFVADAGHELRTPLTTIRGFAELHRQGAMRDEAGTSRAFDRIESEATRMGSLVDDLLTLARLDAQRELDSAPVDLVAVARDAVVDSAAAFPDRLISIHGDLPESLWVAADDGAVRQIVANLMSNAVQHTPAGTRVAIAVRRAEAPEGSGGGRAGGVIDVIDDGPGLTETQAAQVFQRFYRADPSRTRAGGGGSGLGLSIVASLVESMNGAVSVTTAPDRGCVFSVTLPLSP